MIKDVEDNVLFQKAFENSPIGIAVVSLKGEWLQVNKALCEILGYTEQELLATDFQTLTHPEDLKKDTEYMQEVLAGERDSYHIEKRYYHKNGNAIWGLLAVALVRDRDNVPQYFISQIKDITARKKAELALRESEARFNLVVQGTRDGIWDWPDTSGGDVRHYWSRQFYELLGYEEGEIESTYDNFVSMLHPDDVPATDLAVKEHIEDGKPYDVEYRLRCKNGEYKWFLARGAAFVNADGTQRFIGSLTDISEKHRMQEMQERLIDELAESNLELERFAYICSHDLKEPLRTIANFTQQLEKHMQDKIEGDEKAKKYMHFIVNGAQRGQAMIADVLAYSRVGWDESPLEKVDANELIAQLKQEAFDMIQEHGATITHDPLPVIMANRTLIYQMLINLVTNGIKYQSPDSKPVIHVGGHEMAKHWEFYVQDNGIGIDPKFQQKIFEIFQRLHRQEEYGGTGIGLAICKKIVERHGGEIRVESEAGNGARFIFTIKKPAKEFMI